MALFKFKWLRLFIRKHTNPMEVDKAALWKRRLAIGYAVLAWNAFGFVLYCVYNGKADWAKFHNLKSEEESQLTPAQQWTKSLGIKDATVIRVSGLEVSKYKIHNEFDEATEIRRKSMPSWNFMKQPQTQKIDTEEK